MSPRRRTRTRYEPLPPEPDTSEAQGPSSSTGAPRAPGASPESSESDHGLAAPLPASSEGPTPPSGVPGSASVNEPEGYAVPVETIGEPHEAFEVLVEHAVTPPASVVEPARAPRHRIRGTMYLVGFALLAFVTGLIVFNDVVMPRLIHGVGNVMVPDLANLTVEQAEQALRPLNLQLSRAGERFDPAVPRGFVLSQDPEAGTEMRGAGRVTVIVSLGEEFSSVPELFGESMRGARLLIERAGLRVGAVVRAPSDEVGEGLIAGSDPGPETVLPRDMPVHLLISTGARQESYVMPDLAGREIGGVRRQLEAFGFRVSTPPGGGERGTIAAQEPPAGSRITRGSTIVLQATGRMIR
jgi:beta-lactam-binding protein with PASTA domain